MIAISMYRMHGDMLSSYGSLVPGWGEGGGGGEGGEGACLTNQNLLPTPLLDELYNVS